jgi:hypothetical protein
MIALFDFIPRNCPSCGTLLHLNNGTPGKITKFKSYQADTCPGCGLKYQLSKQKDILRAATATGGNLIELMVDSSPDDGE